MIIYSNVVRLIFLLSFVLLFPLIQKQWFNLYLFNINNYTFYSTLYYFSGIIFPIIISLNSIYDFTNYKFNNFLTERLIKGKPLLFLVLIILFPLSLLIISYFYINLDLIFNTFLGKSLNLFSFHISNTYIILITCILLIFRKTRIFIKKLALINFIIFSMVIWHAQFNNLLIDDEISFNQFVNLEDMNYLNVVFLFLIEMLYYLWAYISNKNNLSNWTISIPIIKYYQNLLNILFFFLLTILYYSILK